MAAGDKLATFKNRPRNFIINGALDFWQRATAFSFLSGNDAYTADRWRTVSDFAGGGRIAPERVDFNNTGITTKYAMQVKQLLANATGINTYAMETKLEVKDARHLAGREVTLSFWFYSFKTGEHVVRFLVAGGTEVFIPFTVNNAQSWQKIVITTTLQAGDFSGLDENEEGLSLSIALRYGGFGQTSLDLGQTYRFAEVMLTIGSTTSEFERAGKDETQELSLCERYYERFSLAGRGTPAYSLGSSAIYYAPIQYRTRKRTGVVLSKSADGDFRLIGAASFATTSSIALSSNGFDSCLLQMGSSVSYGAYAALVFRANNSNAFLGFDAEL